MLLHIPVGELTPDMSQPRRTWNPSEIERLAASVAARGILQPIRVIRDKERQNWRIVTGESRWRAAQIAGLLTVPCLPVEGELSETDLLADQIIENHCRHDLRPLDLARAMSRLKKLKGCNSAELAAELGISGASVSRAEALLTLPEEVQQAVDDGRLPESVAYEISRLKDEQAMRDMASVVMTKRLSRDQVIDAVRQKVGRKAVTPKPGKLSGQLDGVKFTFAFASGELTPDTLMRAIEHIRSKLKELQKSEQKDLSALPDLLRAT